MHAELRRYLATFEPKDPPRSGHLVFRDPDRPTTVTELPMAEAVPMLAGPAAITGPSTRGGGPSDHATVAFWRTATVAALEMVAAERIEPTVSADGAVTWQLSISDDDPRLGDLVRAIPAELVADTGPSVSHVRPYLDAVADYLATPDFDAGVRISLRLELPGGTAALESDVADGRFLMVVQVHSLADPALVVDAAELWARTDRFGPGARAGTMLALRRLAGHWPPLYRLLGQKIPDQLALDDDDVAGLLGGGADRLAAMGVAVRWPEDLARDLNATIVIPTTGPLSAMTRTPRPDGTGPFDTTELLHMSWRIVLGGAQLNQSELNTLAEAQRPYVRLRDQWVLVDPRVVEKSGETDPKPLGALDALSAALTGTAEIDGEPVTVEPTGWLETLRERISDPEGGLEDVAPPTGLAATLRGYQVRGLRWLHRMTSTGLGACLADDMGLGKTVTVIALHLHRQNDPATAGRTLVVCPASLLGNWEQEIRRFAPGTPVRRYHGIHRELDAILAETDGGFVITTYATMRIDAGEDGSRFAAGPWAMAVADEAQHVKNAQSRTARALRTISAPARVALTGTPVENNLSELWAILDWTTPGLLGPLTTFRARWADPIESGTQPLANETARRLSRLVGPFLLRRRKSDPGIAPELPPKTVTDRPVTLTAEQAGLYEAAVREHLARIKTSRGMARRGNVLALLTALKQICNHPAQYLKEPLGAPGRSGKLSLLDELVSTIVAEEDAVLIFTQYVAMARLIEAQLVARAIPVQLMHGDTSVDQRERMVQRFQQSPPSATPVFVLSLKAAGTGLNLTRAGHVIHYDRWWNPAVEEQATDRAYRIGQTRPVQVHRLIAEGTVEDRIAAMLETKRELADSVLSAGETALSELSDVELADLVQLRSTNE